MNNDFEFVSCNLCGANDYTVRFKMLSTGGKDNSRKYSASSSFFNEEQIVTCNRCGLQYINPRLKREVILKGYIDGTDEDYVSQNEGRLLTFEKGLDLIEKYAPKKGKILDVGAAAGFFLKVAKENNWETFGVEPNRWMCDYGNKNFDVRIKQGTLKEAAFPDNYFDVITFWDVLEHASDPKSELIEAHRILKHGGLLVVNFPNIGSLLARLFGRRWWFLLSVHLYYFSPETLTKLLTKTGFKPFKNKLHFQKLSLGYLAYRLRPYSPLISNVLRFLIDRLCLNKLQVIYYASQLNTLSLKE